MIAVIQAHKEGKKIQCTTLLSGETQEPQWIDLETPLWDFSMRLYRVKPDPIVAYAVKLPDQYPTLFSYKDNAERYAKRHNASVVTLTEQ